MNIRMAGITTVATELLTPEQTYKASEGKVRTVTSILNYS